ncbi:MAG: ABC transporter ATP-binding protein, partial [Halobacteriaceae archaeon]
VGIPDAETNVDKYPHEYSGGMAQRAMIAMALAGEPDLLIADEPTTGLDVSIQAQILDLFDRLVQEREMSLLLISHDIGIVSKICKRLLVMYAGRIAERGDREDVLEDPRHPYTRAFISSIPMVDRKRELQSIPGSPPDLSNPPSGCRFHPRCPSQAPPEIDFGEGHMASCYVYTNQYDGPGTRPIDNLNEGDDG